MKSSSSSPTLNSKSKFEKSPVMMKMFRFRSCLSIFISNVRVVTLYGSRTKPINISSCFELSSAPRSSLFPRLLLQVIYLASNSPSSVVGQEESPGDISESRLQSIS